MADVRTTALSAAVKTLLHNVSAHAHTSGAISTTVPTGQNDAGVSNALATTQREVEAVRRKLLKTAVFFVEYLDAATLKALAGAIGMADVPSHDAYVNVEGVAVRKRQEQSSEGDAAPAPVRRHPLVVTPAVSANLRRLAFALTATTASAGGGRPILVEGPAGCGKTSYVRYLADRCGYGHDLLELHLDDATDGKALLGTYVCTDIPGEFKWQPGAVTSAARAGRWVLIEDVDRAPFEVLASLRQLQEHRWLHIPGQARPVHAHPGFQLWATRTTTVSSVGPGGDVITPAVSGPLAAFADLWLRVPVTASAAAAAASAAATAAAPAASAPQLSDAALAGLDAESAEAQLLVSTMFPSLPPDIVHSLRTVYTTLLPAYALDRSAAAAAAASASAAAASAVPLPKELAGLGRFGRAMSARDLLRWARRVHALTPVLRRAAAAAARQVSGSSPAATAPVFLTDEDKLAIVHEAGSVFGDHVPDAAVRRALYQHLAITFGLAADTADMLLTMWKPVVKYMPGPTQGSLLYCVGSIRLPVGSPAILQAVAERGGELSPLPPSFAPTKHSLRLLERLTTCVALDEPALLVGETGNGKTSIIQALARGVGASLHVYNLNVQSDSADLLGGFKPVHLKQIGMPLLARFEDLFSRTFTTGNNASFVEAVRASAHAEQWARAIAGFARALQRAEAQLAAATDNTEETAHMRRGWEQFSRELRQFERQFSVLGSRSPAQPAGEGSQDAGASAGGGAAFAFTFIEGVLVRALQEGHWLLLDEINLASPEMLQRLSGVLEGGSVTLTERGDADPVPHHPNFRLFAAMNPATDFGKRDLPPALRSRFTELYVPDVEDREDIAIIAQQYVSSWPHTRGLTDPADTVDRIVRFYLEARRLAAPLTGTLRDGAATRPHYSLRSLTRALRAATDLIAAGFTVPRALHEGICMSFLTQLEESSAAVLSSVITAHFKPGATSASASASGGDAGKKKGKSNQAALAASVIAKLGGGSGGASAGSTAGTEPEWDASSSASRSAETHVNVASFWLQRGPKQPVDMAQPQPGTGAVGYVVVPSVQRHVRSLARAVLCARYPVLLQGPTSAGKTSMVEYLALLTGHECVRINNHEHTDLAEYIGSYVTAPDGRLVFSEGLLVQALRSGKWLILDELNLAPSEVLEALNRLLDDNRELFIPETQEIVKPHAHFMLFATQNPVGAYGGRKPLSLAFRNRFVELHVDDIPAPELVTILMQRSRLPQSFVERMVEVMTELQRLRQGSDVFAGKHGFITPRDLLRWASRKPDSYAALAQEGYMLLGERLRHPAEQAAVRGVLERLCKGPLDLDALYDGPFHGFITDADGVGQIAAAAENSFGAGAGAGQKRNAREEGGSGSGSAPPPAKRSRNSTATSSAGAAEEDETQRFMGMVTHRLQQFLGELRQSADAPAPALPPTATATASVPRGQQQGQLNLRPGAVPGTEGLTTITITRALRRLFCCVSRCIANNEAVLLVGDTGIGKTTVVQLLALLLQQPLAIVNCHAHTETADFLGSLRPVRNRVQHAQSFRVAAAQVVQCLPPAAVQALAAAVGAEPGTTVEALHKLEPAVCMEKLQPVVTPLLVQVPGAPSEQQAAQAALAAAWAALQLALKAAASLFEWVDGPLVTSMKQGHFFLLDEASLAEDAVLERLNSVLEPSRTLTLAEKADDTAAAAEESSLVIRAAPAFRFFATMNPGGDFGKRELSPALRNRFTEIWVPALGNAADLHMIIADKAADVALRLHLRSPAAEHPLKPFVGHMLAFVQWFDRHAASGRFDPHAVTDDHAAAAATTAAVSAAAASAPVTPQAVSRPRPRVFQLSLRDLHAWLSFMGTCLTSDGGGSGQQVRLSPWLAYAHGACLVLLDGLGLGMGLPLRAREAIRRAAAQFLIAQAPASEGAALRSVLLPGELESAALSTPTAAVEAPEGMFGIQPFYIPVGQHAVRRQGYALQAPTTRSNLLRVLRALQLRKPILLEGSPGVGKTSLIEALARSSGHQLVRINLSEQTDLSDLFGQDLPVASNSNDEAGSSGGSGASAGGFAWCDGVFLQALKAGAWVLLDELNLAPQAVLEGLNAVLDHRGTVYLPELDRSFACPPSFRVFATQNPVTQGGGRKGLPKSFLNRFAKVHVQPLSSTDQHFIASTLYPQLDVPVAATASSSSDNSSAVSGSPSLLQLMVAFNMAMHKDTMGADAVADDTLEGAAADTRALYGSAGRPWEFNLRDLFRWCEVILRMQGGGGAGKRFNPSAALDFAYLQRLRTAVDRAGCAARYLSLLGPALLTDSTQPATNNSGAQKGADALTARSRHLAGLLNVSEAPVLLTSPAMAVIDDAVLLRAPVPGLWRCEEDHKALFSKIGNSQAALLVATEAPITVARYAEERSAGDAFPVVPTAASLRVAYHAAVAVRHAWPVLLVGRKASGKTSALRLLAQLVGARLREIPLTPATDATELIGCFEQADVSRKVAAVIDATAGLVIAARHAAAAELTQLSPVLAAHHESFVRAQGDTLTGLHPSFQRVLDTLTAVAAAFTHSAPTVAATWRAAVERLGAAAHRHLAATTAAATSSAGAGTARGAFEWVDGALIEAMERGEWVVIENVNFCNASVVDRLNPVLEPHGSLLINECGLDAAGKPRLIKPHPSFRIFFTLNPSLGDVSRALRNRCVEIALSDGGAAAAGTGHGPDFSSLLPAILPSALPHADTLRAAARLLHQRISRTYQLSRRDKLQIADAAGGACATVSKALVQFHDAAVTAVTGRSDRRLASAEPAASRQLAWGAELFSAVAHRQLQLQLAGMRGAASACPSLSAAFGGVLQLVYSQHGGGAVLSSPAVQDSLAAVLLPSTSLLPCAELVPSAASVAAHMTALPLYPAAAAVVAWMAQLPEGRVPPALLQQGEQLMWTWLCAVVDAAVLGSAIAGDNADSRCAALERALLSTPRLPTAVAETLIARAATASAGLRTYENAFELIETARRVDASSALMRAALFLAPVQPSRAVRLWTAIRATDDGEALHAACTAAVVHATLQADIVTMERRIVMDMNAAAAAGAVQGCRPYSALCVACTLAARLGASLPHAIQPAVEELMVPTRALEQALGGTSIAAVPPFLFYLLSTFACGTTSDAAASQTAVAEAAAELFALLHSTRVTMRVDGSTAAPSAPAPASLLPRLVLLWRKLVKSLRTHWAALSTEWSNDDCHRLLLKLQKASAALTGYQQAVSPPMPLRTGAAATPSSVQQLLAVALAQPRDTLWRLGGHPHVPRSASAFKALRDVLGAFSRLRGVPLYAHKGVGGMPLSVTAAELASAPLRAQLMELLATAATLAAQPVTVGSSDAADAILVSASASLLQHASQWLQQRAPPARTAALLGALEGKVAEVGTAMEDAAAVTTGADDDDEYDAGGIGDGTSGGVVGLGVDDALLDRLQITHHTAAYLRRAIRLQVAGAVEEYCLVEERELHAAVLRLFIGGAAPESEDTDTDTAATAQACSSRLRRLLQLCLAATRWGPEDLLGLQLLSWVLNLSAADATARQAAFASLLPILLSSWHARAASSRLHVLQATAGVLQRHAVDALVHEPCSLSDYEGRVFLVQLLSAHATSNEGAFSAAGTAAGAGAAGAAGAAVSRERSITACLLGHVLHTFASTCGVTAEAVAQAAADATSWLTAVQAGDSAAASKASDAVAATLSRTTDIRLSACLASHVLPALASVSSLPLVPDAHQLAQAALRVELLRLQLLLPAEPVDPATKPALQRNNAESTLQRYSTLLLHNELHGAVAHGTPVGAEVSACIASEDDAASSLAIAIQHLEGKMAAYAARSVYRPSPGYDASGLPAVSFHDLFVEAHSFVASLVASGRIEQLLAAWSAAGQAGAGAGAGAGTGAGAESAGGSGQLRAETAAWVDAALGFAERLRGAFVSFSDIAQPLEAAVRGAAAAAASLVRLTTSANSADAVAPPASAVSSLEDKLNLSQVVASQRKAGEGVVSQLAVRDAANQLSSAIGQWLAVRDGEEEEAAAQASAAGILRGVTDDERMEQEFRERMPDYFTAHFAEFLKDPRAPPGTAPIAAPAAAAAAAAASSSGAPTPAEVAARRRQAAATTALQLTSAYLGLFGSSSDTGSGGGAEGADRSRMSLLASATLAHADAGTTPGAAAPLLLHQLQSLLPRAASDAPALNFYKDSNVPEAVTGIKPVRAFAVRVLELLRGYPGNEVLAMLLRICDQFFKLSVLSPIAALLAGAELLVTKAQEWEQNAPSSLSLGQPFVAVSQLVTRWRKIELASWTQVLHSTEREANGPSAELFLRLRALLLSYRAGAATDDAAAAAGTLRQAFDSADRFLRGSSLGAFRIRLQLLEACAAELEGLAEEAAAAGRRKGAERLAALARILRNVHAYYAQYIPAATAALDQAKAPVLKNVHDQVKIHRWDEQSYYAMKESAEKGHRIVFKAMLAYREVLLRVIGPVLQGEQPLPAAQEGLPQPVAVKAGKRGKAAAAEVAADAAEQAQLQDAEARVTAVKQQLTVLLPTAAAAAAPTDKLRDIRHRMHQLLLKPRTGVCGSGAVRRRALTAMQVSAWAGSLMSTAAALKAGEAGKMIKKRAVVGTMRNLARCGLSYLSTAVPASQADLSAIMLLPRPQPTALLPLFSTADATAAGSMLSKAENYYARSLDQLLRLRLQVAAGDWHKDVTVTEARRGLGLCEHAFYLLCQQRTALATVQDVGSRLPARAARLQALSAAESAPRAISSDVLLSCAIASAAGVEHELQSLRVKAAAAKALLRSLARTMAGDVLTSGGVVGVDNVAEEAVTMGAVTSGDAGPGADAAAPAPALAAALPPVLTRKMKQLTAVEDLVTAAAAKVAAARLGLESCLSVSKPPLPSVVHTQQLQQLMDAYTAVSTDCGAALSTTAADSALLLKQFLLSCLRRVRTAVTAAQAEAEKVLQASTAPAAAEPAVLHDQLRASCDALVMEAQLCAQSLVPRDGAAAASAAVEHVWGLEPAEEDQAAASSSASGASDSMEDATAAAADETDEAAAAAEDDSILRVPLVASQDRAVRTLSLAVSVKLLAAADNVIHRACALVSTDALTAAESATLSHLHALLRGLGGVYATVARDALAYHAACGKLALVLSGMLLGLMKEGYCLPDKNAKEGDAGDGEGGEGGGPEKEGKFEAGTGIGEGSGKRDVSDQIENEEQVLGLRNEQKQQQQEQEEQGGAGGEKEEDKGLEMNADFEGEMHDMPPPPEDEEEGRKKKKGEESEDEEEEEADIDREMGSADDDNAQMVDEKLWDGADDEEEEEEEAKPQPKKMDTAVKGDQRKPGAMRAKEGESEQQEGEQGAGEGEEGGEEAEEQAGAEAEGEEAGEEEEGRPPQTNDQDDSDEETQTNKGKEAQELGHDSDDEKLEGSDNELPAEDKRNKVKPVAEEALGDEEEEEGDGQQEQQEQGEGAEEGAEGEEAQQGAEDKPGEGDEAAEEFPENLQLNEEGQEEEEEEGEDGEGSQAEGEEEDAVMKTSEADEGSPEEQQQQEAQADGVTAPGAEAEEPEGEGEEAAQPDAPAPQPQAKQPMQQMPPAPGVASRSGSSRVTGKAAKGRQQEEKPEQQEQEGKEEEAEDELADQEAAAMGENEEEEDQAGIDGAGDDMAGARGGSQGKKWQEDKAPGRKQPAPPAGRKPGSSEPVKGQRPNPLLNPAEALRQWQAKLHQQRAGEQPPEDGADSDAEADGDADAGADAPADVLSHAAGGVSMLAPRAEEDEDEDENDMQDAEAALPEESSDEEDDDDRNAAAAAAAQAEESEEEDDFEMADATDAKAKQQRSKDKQQQQRKEGGAEGMADISHLHGGDSDDEGGSSGAEDGDGLGGEADKVMAELLAPPPAAAATAASMPVMSTAAAVLAAKASASSAMDATPMLSAEELALLREQYEASLTSWSVGSGRAGEAWSALSAITAEPAARLCEGLRLVLEPTLASKLGGEYRSGKRINMRKVIPYIASNFRKDKIWMRRSKPSKRTYQVLLAIDDSLSMAPSNRGAGAAACEAMAVIAKALTKLEVGELGVMSYGAAVQLLHPLDAPFTDDAGARILSKFTFAQESTRTDTLMSAVTSVMDAARASASARAAASTALSAAKCMQLVFLLSDGIVGSGAEREKIRQWVIEATRRGLLVVLLVLDTRGTVKTAAGGAGAGAGAAAAASSGSAADADADSITRTQTISFVNGQVVRQAYLDDYPFPYYLVLRDLKALPEVLSDAIRQWFALVAGKD